MRHQSSPSLSKAERDELTKALQHIGEKKKDGNFTVRATKLQAIHGSSIEIQKKLRKGNHIKHIHNK